jgi:hypothetical protein
MASMVRFLFFYFYFFFPLLSGYVCELALVFDERGVLLSPSSYFLLFLAKQCFYVFDSVAIAVDLEAGDEP